MDHSQLNSSFFQLRQLFYKWNCGPHGLKMNWFQINGHLEDVKVQVWTPNDNWPPSILWFHFQTVWPRIHPWSEPKTDLAPNSHMNWILTWHPIGCKFVRVSKTDLVPNQWPEIWPARIPKFTDLAPNCPQIRLWTRRRLRPWIKDRLGRKFSYLLWSIKYKWSIK